MDCDDLVCESRRDDFTSSVSTTMEKTVINVAAPFLSQEIIANILKRLPVKSLLRFRCVCKHWKNFFKTPSFIQDHLRHSSHHNTSLLLGAENFIDGFYLFLFNCKMQFREIDNAPLNGSLRGFELVGSSDGLLCFVNTNKHPPAPLLWNPATRALKQVPCDEFSGLYSDNNSDIDFGWRFGFGFNPIINDYKIVRLSGRSIDISEATVYSLSTGSWRNIEFDEIDVCICITTHGVTVNGVMFWLGTDDSSHVIVSFDLATEVVAVIPCAAFIDYSVNHVGYDDKLAIISHHKTGNSQHSSIYLEVMEVGGICSSGQRWGLSKKLVGNSNLILCDRTIWRNQIVCIMEYMEHLYIIDVIGNGCKRFDIPKPKTGIGLKVFNYVESIVPVSAATFNLKNLNPQG